MEFWKEFTFLIMPPDRIYGLKVHIYGFFNYLIFLFFFIQLKHVIMSVSEPVIEDHLSLKTIIFFNDVFLPY